MRKKDIITLVIAIAVIGASVFFVLRLLFPPQENTTVTQESESIQEVPTTIDETTYSNIESLSDYGQVNLEGLGKRDLFSGF